MMLLWAGAAGGGKYVNRAIINAEGIDFESTFDEVDLVPFRTHQMPKNSTFLFKAKGAARILGADFGCRS